MPPTLISFYVEDLCCLLLEQAKLSPESEMPSLYTQPDPQVIFRRVISHPQEEGYLPSTHHPNHQVFKT